MRMAVKSIISSQRPGTPPDTPRSSSEPYRTCSSSPTSSPPRVRPRGAWAGSPDPARAGSAPANCRLRLAPTTYCCPAVHAARDRDRARGRGADHPLRDRHGGAAEDDAGGRCRACWASTWRVDLATARDRIGDPDADPGDAGPGRAPRPVTCSSSRASTRSSSRPRAVPATSSTWVTACCRRRRSTTSGASSSTSTPARVDADDVGARRGGVAHAANAGGGLRGGRAAQGRGAVSPATCGSAPKAAAGTAACCAAGRCSTVPA